MICTMTESTEPGRTLAERLRALVGTLPPAEQKVARTLLAGYPTVALEPVAALARRATVSAPTVLRLAQRLGFAGYADLQTALKIELQDRLTSPLTQYDTSFGEAPGPRSRDMFSRGIRETFGQLPDGELERAAALLADGRRPAWTIGGYFSTLLARYLVMHLRQLRPRATYVSGGVHEHAEYLIDIGRSDTVVVFDYRRYQSDTVRFAEQAAARGAKVVLFTDPWLSPAAAVADVVLPATVTTPSPFDALTPAMALVEALVAAIVDEMGEVPRERVSEFDQLLTADREVREH